MLKKITLPVCILLSSCAVGPNYKEPQLKIAHHWMQASPRSDAEVKEVRIRNADWWKIFSDPNLNQLILQGYHNNLDLQTAGVRILKSRAQLAQTVGSLYPQQQVMDGGYTYQRIGGSSLQDVLPQSFSLLALGFSANWEIDFWGKYRRAIESKDAGFLASVAAYDSALVSLTADIAATYISIRTYEELIKVTKANMQVQETSLKIARSRYNAGQTSLLDVQQAKTEYSQTSAQLPMQVASLKQQKNKLAVLLGMTPPEIDKFLAHNRPIPKALAQIEVGIPREALAKRPDICQARLRAMEQAAAIGAIKANLYPAFSLAGTFAFNSNNIGMNSLDELFNWSNRAITAGPAFTWPILNYGQITNAVRAQDAAFQESLLNYKNTVLKAQQEVQDGINNYVEGKKSLRDLTLANRSAIQSSRLALIRYKEGEVNYTTVLDAQRQQLQIQTSLTNAKGNISLAVVTMYRALGGGWQLRKGHDVVPHRLKQEMAERTGWGDLLVEKNHMPPKTRQQQLNQTLIPDW